VIPVSTAQQLERSSPFCQSCLQETRRRIFFSFATSSSETRKLYLQSSTVLPRSGKRKPCCGGATPGQSGSNMRWEMLLRSCLRSFCRPGLGCLKSCPPNFAHEKGVADIIQAGAGTVLRSRSGMELTCGARSGAR
jgi:hypothetical protein